ncbi:hypothetical protein, conserved [Babesia ovata]|uniref:6-Cys domain-containing protein n=1 Tax=Babesia ovata TaxID=189622 RepID=A0A2H6KB64_9APIC|nr:uncharacterized protein BOVATA_017180 [Babesia ovata]GBE60225.1 hypothetical protein, conserved [Babesia ovata]
MMKFRIIYLWPYCALWIHCILSREPLNCDFGDPHDLLSSNALVFCRMDIDDTEDASVVCPRRVNNTEYVWHPQPTPGENSNINAYVSNEGTFHPVALSDVIVTESPVAYISVESDVSQTKLKLDFQMAEIYAITEPRLIFICGPRNLVPSDALQRHLDRLNGLAEMQAFPWYPASQLTQEIKKVGTGLGIFNVYRDRTRLPLQGCGSRHSPIFSPDNKVVVDRAMGTRSCVADPVSLSPIGFLCEGRIEPEDCMKSLLDKNGEVVKAPQPHFYWAFENNKPLAVVQYFNKLALSPFHGECRCVDPETGRVKARIEIRSKNEYICDIASMIFLNRFRPIHGPWCSVMLHPGSALTIRLPIASVDSCSITGDYNYDFEDDLLVLPFSQLPSIYEYETEFLPKDLTSLRQLKTTYDVDLYEEILYNKALAGDALELDVSQMSRGEIKLKYHPNKLLASIGGDSSFLYHWTLISRNENVLDKVRAIVNVSLAFTHSYLMVGCDRGPQGVFDPGMSKRYCSVKQMENGIGPTYECTIHIMRGHMKAGIHCSPGEELLPNNCDSVGYDLYSNRIIPPPRTVRTATRNNIRGFQVLDFYFLNNCPVSYACVCVDQGGYEKSRLVFETNRHETETYLVRLEEAYHMVAPHLLPPVSEFGLSNELPTLTTLITAPHASKKHIMLKAGTTLVMSCAIDTEVQNVENNGAIDITWLPENSEYFYYTVNQTPGGPALVKAAYTDSLVTTPGGLEVRYSEYDKRRRCKELAITSHRGAILISKDPLHKKYVPIRYVCGKTPDASDLSVITGKMSAFPNLPTIGSLARYTWNVVKVNVETTDPYMQGCGVTQSSVELFKPETPKLYNAHGQLKFGCKIDIQAAGEAAFYCPAPYVLDPPNCFSQVSVGGVVTNTGDLSKSLVSSHSNHFVILRLYSSLIGPGETMRQTPPLECRCVTVKGVVLSTVQIENYYAK